METYSRFESLKKNINDLLCKLTKDKKDYISQFTIQDYVEIKSLLSNVNNTLTLLTTLSTVEWIGQFLKVENETLLRWLNEVDAQKPNTNGFDITIKEKKIIAEVKTTNPINGGEYFGAAQKDSLMLDIVKLLDSDKAKEYIKILAIAKFDNDRIEKAINSFLIEGKRNNSKSSWRVKYHDIINNKQVVIFPSDISFEDLDYDKVYIKVIDLNIDKGNNQ